MQKSKKLKMKLISRSIIVLLWMLFGIAITKIFDFHGWIWNIIYIVVFGFPFVLFVTNSRWIYEEYTEIKTKEDYEKSKQKS